MKQLLTFVLCISVFFPLVNGVSQSQVQQPDVVRVATALDHLTVLEFGEPVTMAAAGSSAFQIERHEDKVFIKPLRAGATTDLFVWTVSRRFTYELEQPGETRNMNFLVDNRRSLPTTEAPNNTHLDEIADMMLTRAFLGAERIDNHSIRDIKGRVSVRIEHVFCSKESAYIHYSVRNLGARPYRLLTPTITELFPAGSKVSLPALRYTQLNRSVASRIETTSTSAISVATAAAQKQDIGAGEEAQGVVVIRQRVEYPVVLRLRFGADEKRQVEATVIL